MSEASRVMALAINEAKKEARRELMAYLYYTNHADDSVSIRHERAKMTRRTEHDLIMGGPR